MGKTEKPDSDDDVDALFRLPLAEFTGARNALAAQLKKSGRGDDAVLVKGLAKPSISAWAVNQLYWNHREAFDQLIVSGERFHKAQKSGKVAVMRESIDARRDALTHLSDLATTLLRAAGHNPSPDTIHRITTTLEGISAYAQRPDGRHSGRAGRLTNDVDPPGFESFSAFVPGMTMQEAGGRRQEAGGRKQEARGRKQVAGGSRQEAGITQRAKDEKRQLEEAHKSRIAAAKVSLQDAKRSLTEARARAQRLEAAQKKADAEAKKAESNSKKAKAASEDAARRARSVAEEVEEAASAVDDAERTVEKASKELESLSR